MREGKRRKKSDAGRVEEESSDCGAWIVAHGKSEGIMKEYRHCSFFSSPYVPETNNRFDFLFIWWCIYKKVPNALLPQYSVQ